MSSLKPFFDIIIFSKLPKDHIVQIIDHIETVLNAKTLVEIRQFAEKKLSWDKKFLRLKSIPLQAKCYFNNVLQIDQYIYIEKANEYIENLSILTVGRPKDNVFFLSNHHFRIVSAINAGFNTIPIVHFDGLTRDDY